MKVICIDKCTIKTNHIDLLKAYRDIKIGDIYTVIYSQIINGNLNYELEEFIHPCQILWEAKCFVPVSEIDENEFERNYKFKTAL